MMTDFGDFRPEIDSARSRSGKVHPPAVPSAAKLPIRNRSRRETPSQKSRWEVERPAIVSIINLLPETIFDSW
jgi:hypothetical protein